MKRIISLFVSMCIFLTTFSVAFAADNNAKDSATKVPKKNDTIMRDGWYYWEIESNELISSASKGAYKTVGSVTIKKKDAPQDITVTGSRTYGHQISGTVKVSRKTLEGYLGFSYNYSVSKSIAITKRGAGAGTYLAQSRGVYYRYKVKQQQYYRIDGYSVKVGKPVYCEVLKFRYEDHRLTKK